MAAAGGGEAEGPDGQKKKNPLEELLQIMKENFASLKQAMSSQPAS